VEKLLLDAALQLDESEANHPRNELDFVADMNCWHRSPTGMWQEFGAPWAEDVDKYIAHWISGKKIFGPDVPVAEPIAILVSELWQKLANRDLTVKPVAEGFRMTGTPGARAGAGGGPEHKNPYGLWSTVGLTRRCRPAPAFKLTDRRISRRPAAPGLTTAPDLRQRLRARAELRLHASCHQSPRYVGLLGPFPCTISE
jgi:hypothetical protein